MYHNAVPIFADVDIYKMNVDPESIRKRITKNTKAIICTHLFGSVCEMDRINQIAKEHNLSQTHIGRCLNINCNDRTCKGFSFTYLSRGQLINHYKSKGKIVLSLSKNYC